MNIPKPRLTFGQIINMNIGFFGIQYSFGLQQSAVNPIYDMLGASPDQIPILNLAGPLTGLLIQPIIGAMSDKTWHPRWGRRKPYFLTGAMLCSLCLFFYPFSSSLWMAVGLLWVLDAANNTAMEPYRAFIADKLPPDQHATGFLTQSFFTGLGITLANVSLFIFQEHIKGSYGSIPYWVFGSFFLGSICSIASVGWSVSKTPEIPPTLEELEEMQKHKSSIPAILQFFLSVLTAIITYVVLLLLLIPSLFYKGLIKKVIAKTEANSVTRALFSQNIEIVDAITTMPKVMWQLALIYLFQWYALFCYWQYASKSIAQSVWKTNIYQNNPVYDQAVGWTGLVNGYYNIITFLSAFALVGLAKKFSAKGVHMACLAIAGIGLLIFPHIENKFLLFAPMTGFGIAWASMMGVPYLMVVGNIPKERYGVYMGIINMMIVIPMILQNLTFGFVLKHFLGNDPGKAISFGGAFLLIACIATIFIKPRPVSEAEVPMELMAAGH